MTQEEMSLALINATIKVIAYEGLEKTTTKAIATTANLNEVYIYRLFGSKEDLLAKSFEVLDNELADNVLKNFGIMCDNNRDFVSKCKELFYKIWDFLLSNQERCVSYIRYYYSSYFRKYSEEIHMKLFAQVIDDMTPAFADANDVVFFLQHFLNTMLDLAIKVFYDFIENSNETCEKAFFVLFSSVKPYLKPDLV